MIYAACVHIQLLQLCCRILIAGQMVNGIGNWSRLRVTTFYGWVVLSQSDPFSGAVSFPTAQLYQDGWGRGPGEEVSSGDRIVMGEESTKGHFSWYCCQKKCSLNHSPVACPAKSCGSSQCQGHNPAFQPNVLWCNLFSSSVFGSSLSQWQAWSSRCWKEKWLVLDGRNAKPRANSSKKGAGDNMVSYVMGME